MSRWPRSRQRVSRSLLIDAGVIDRIVRNVAPRPGPPTLEWTPGRGTRAVGLVAPGRLPAVAIDCDLAARGLGGQVAAGAVPP